jgi:hypothetical protein
MNDLEDFLGSMFTLFIIYLVIQVLKGLPKAKKGGPK